MLGENEAFISVIPFHFESSNILKKRWKQFHERGKGVYETEIEASAVETELVSFSHN